VEKLVLVVLVLLIYTPMVNAKTYTKTQCKNYAYKQVIKNGWTKSDYNNLIRLWNKESGWNARAVNKYSKSCGIPQAYPCFKMAKYGKDYRTNCKTQIRFGIDYISKRYKNPTKAWTFWKKHHWY
jgi:hypothetical protein